MQQCIFWHSYRFTTAKILHYEFLFTLEFKLLSHCTLIAPFLIHDNCAHKKNSTVCNVFWIRRWIINFLRKWAWICAKTSTCDFILPKADKRVVYYTSCVKRRKNYKNQTNTTWYLNFRNLIIQIAQKTIFILFSIYCMTIYCAFKSDWRTLIFIIVSLKLTYSFIVHATRW